MPTLPQSKLRKRRQFDYRVLSGMRGGKVEVSTHLTANDAERGRNPVSCVADAEHAAHYRAVFRFQTLVGPGEYNSPTIVRIDASAREYPYCEPTAWPLAREGSRIPWSPHFLSGVPVCLGTIWRQDGQVLIGHLVLHIGRLLNWDEHLNPGYAGYNGAAVRWWRKNLGRPLNPDLTYPSLPLDELYGAPVVRRASGFRAVTSVQTGGFRAIGGTHA